jgi:hypothetical protein
MSEVLTGASASLFNRSANPAADIWCFRMIGLELQVPLVEILRFT